MKLRKGLSLVEIVAVIAIIAIISLAAMARFQNVNEAARVATLESTFNTITTAFLMQQALTGGVLPTDWADLAPHINGVRADTAANALIDIQTMFRRIGGATGGTPAAPPALGTGSNPVLISSPAETFTATAFRFSASIGALDNDYSARTGQMTTPVTGPATGVYTLRFSSDVTNPPQPTN